MESQNERQNLLASIKAIIVGLVETDQDFVLLEVMFNAGARERIIARIDETVGKLMKIRESIKSLSKDSYINKKD